MINNLEAVLTEAGKRTEYLVVILSLILSTFNHEDESNGLINAWHHKDLFKVCAGISHHHDLCFFDSCILVHRSINSMVSCVNRLEMTMGHRCRLEL